MYAFTGFNASNLMVFDLASPASPEFIRYIDVLAQGKVFNLTVRGSTLLFGGRFSLQPGEGSLLIFDVSDPSRPVLTSALGRVLNPALTDPARGADYDGSRIYLATTYSGLQIHGPTLDLRIVSNEANSVTLEIDGIPHTDIILESTADLNEPGGWQTVRQLNSATFPIQINDLALSPPSRFYRLRRN